MSVNSTKLQKLIYYGHGDLLKVEHPETVLTLDSDLPAERLRSFRNLRHLRSSSNLRILSERTLLNFPDLKEIAYTGTYDDVWEAFEGYERIKELPPFLERFMAKKKELGRTDLKVQFVSLQLVDHKPIKDYRFDAFFSDYDDRYQGCSFGELELHAHNYDQLIDTVSTSEVYYNELMEAFGWRLPNDFCSKFVGIRCVNVHTSHQLDEEHLLQFLQSVSVLEKFILSGRQTLSESFFRRLAECCSNSLHSMYLGLGDLVRLQNLDFSRAFGALNFFILDIELSPKEIRWLLDMSWPRKAKFHVIFQHMDPKSKRWIQYGVTRCLESKMAFLYRVKDHLICFQLTRFSKPQIRLRTCSLARLGELANYFDYLETQA